MAGAAHVVEEFPHPHVTLPPISSLNVDVQDLIDRLVAKGLEPVTVQCAILPLRAIYERAVDRGELAVNPTSKVNVPRVRRARDRIRIPSLDEARALLAPLELRDRALYGTALYAGLRLGELQALRWENVDLATGVIHVEAGWDPTDREVIEPRPRTDAAECPSPVRCATCCSSIG